MTKLLSFCLAAIAFAGAAHAHDTASTATYLGNEGVLVARGETKVVFDAFYDDSSGNYAQVPGPITKALLDGDAPYDDIDAVFVSHVHADHFSATRTIAFLRAHDQVRLYGSRQVHDAIVDAVGKDDPLLSRIVTADLVPTDPAKSYDLDGLHIEVVAIPHAGKRSRGMIQNLSWRVTLDDATTVLHLGDADTVAADFQRHAAHFAARHADVAFPPHWFFGNAAGEAIVETHIKASQVIGIHVPRAAIDHGDAWRERAGGDLFTDPGETRTLGD